jgi:hypothetical protein
MIEQIFLVSLIMMASAYTAIFVNAILLGIVGSYSEAAAVIMHYAVMLILTLSSITAALTSIVIVVNYLLTL